MLTENLAVVIPTLAKRPAFLLSAIESAKACRVGMVLVISPSNLPSWMSHSHRETLTWIKFSGDLTQSLNHAFSLVPQSFPYMTWIGDDDLMEPEGYEDLIVSEEAELVIGSCLLIDESGTLDKVHKVAKWRVHPWAISVLASPIAQPATFFKRSLFERLAGLDGKYKLAFDQDFFTRAIVGGAQLQIVENHLASYRVHAGTLSNTNWELSLLESARVRRSNCPVWMLPAVILVDKLRLFAVMSLNSLISARKSI